MNTNIRTDRSALDVTFLYSGYKSCKLIKISMIVTDFRVYRPRLVVPDFEIKFPKLSQRKRRGRKGEVDGAAVQENLGRRIFDVLDGKVPEVSVRCSLSHSVDHHDNIEYFLWFIAIADD